MTNPSPVPTAAEIIELEMEREIERIGNMSEEELELEMCATLMGHWDEDEDESESDTACLETFGMCRAEMMELTIGNFMEDKHRAR